MDDLGLPLFQETLKSIFQKGNELGFNMTGDVLNIFGASLSEMDPSEAGIYFIKQ